MNEQNRPIGIMPCGECDEELRPDQPAMIYDGEWCHIDCVAHAEDAVGFDDFFGDS